MKTTKLFRLPKRILNSTCLLVFIYFCILPFLCAYVRPLHYLDPAQAIPMKYRTLVSKISRFLNASADPDIVLLGSSLFLLPAVRCDDEMEGREPRYDQQYSWYIQDYAEAKYFEHLLSERIGLPMRVTNLGVTGALVSDVYLIIKKAVAIGKKPRLIMFGIAPRDFMTRELPSVTSTPIYEMLGDLSCLDDLVKNHVSCSEVLQFALRTIWHFYSEHGDYRALLTNWICSSTGHPQTLATLTSTGERAQSSQANNKTNVPATQAKQLGIRRHKSRKNKLNDLDLYRRRYNPPDWELFGVETSYFEELLRICNQSQIPIVVLNMPLTVDNKSLLPSGILNRYKNMISQVTAKHRIKLVDLETQAKFYTCDFEDSCHLNASGGDKLYKALVEILLADPMLACHLKSPHLGSLKNNIGIGISQHQPRYH